MTVEVSSYATAHPGDTRDLQRHLARLDAARVRRLALLVKTEGNAEVNDYSREYALQSAQAVLAARGLLDRATFLISTGCEGAMTPFGYLFADVEDTAAPSLPAALAIGCARSRSLAADDIGTTVHAEITASTLRAALADAQVTAADVGLAIVKTPVMSLAPGSPPATRITSAYSKAVGALGAGVALGEVDPARVVPAAFDRDLDLHARRAMVFSGAELDCVEIMVLANRAGASGRLAVHTGFFADVLDGRSLAEMFARAGCTLDAYGRVGDPARVVATMIKAGARPDGHVRGQRTTITSSHIDMDKHVRAAMSGVIGAILGETRTFISANTVHQAPAGGGLAAIIVRA